MKLKYIRGIFFFIMMNLMFCTDSGTKKAVNDFSKGVLRIYVFGELLKNEPKLATLMKANGVELYHLTQGEMQRISQQQIKEYNAFMRQKISEKFSYSFIDSLENESKK